MCTNNWNRYGTAINTHVRFLAISLVIVVEIPGFGDKTYAKVFDKDESR